MASSLRSFAALFIFLLCIDNEVLGKENIYNMVSYTPLASGNTDTTQALLKAWNQACQSKKGGVVIVPPGTFLVNNIKFEGPCNGPMTIQMNGIMRAPSTASLGEDHWILFSNIDGLIISGNGGFDGQGPFAWPHNSCGNGPCPDLPSSVKFNKVKNARIQGIKSLNSKFFHLVFGWCENVNIHNVLIQAPKDSPNTDGIHISNSNNIRVTDARIATGDDCVSIGPGSTNINITRVLCGPGHGISIGSLGRYRNEANVRSISVTDSTLVGTTNGVRIKTWAPSPPSAVSDVTFENIILSGVENPVIIDQLYCPYSSCSHSGDSQVRISDVKFINIRGTSASEVSVALNCSRSVPCQGILLEDLNIDYKSQQAPTIATCSNVKGTFYRSQSPRSCVKAPLDLN